jgi:hypothetical protein
MMTLREKGGNKRPAIQHFFSPNLMLYPFYLSLSWGFHGEASIFSIVLILKQGPATDCNNSCYLTLLFSLSLSLCKAIIPGR